MARRYVPYRKFVVLRDQLIGPGPLIKSITDETYTHLGLAQREIAPGEDADAFELVFGWLREFEGVARVYSWPQHEDDGALRAHLARVLAQWAQAEDKFLDFDSAPADEDWMPGS